MRSSWALVDQGLTSIANFATIVILGTQLTAQEFGWFTVVSVLVLFALAAQAALVWQPQSVIYQLVSESEREHVLASTQAAQVLLTAVCAVLVFVALLLLGVGAAASPLTVLMWLGAWQTQEYTRRVQYARFRYRQALASDVLAYGLQPLFLLAAASSHRLDASLAIGIMTATSVAGALVGIAQNTLVRHGPSRHHLVSIWRYGRWLLLAQLGSYASVQLPILVAAYLVGARAAGELRAAQTVLGFLNVPLIWLGSTLPARLASAWATASDPFGILRRAYTGVMPLAMLFCLLTAVFPDVFIKVMFNPELLPAATLVPGVALYSFVVMNSLFLVCVLQAARATRRVGMGYLAAGIIGLLVAFPLISGLGAAGAVISILLASIVSAVIFTLGAREFLQAWRSQG